MAKIIYTALKTFSFDYTHLEPKMKKDGVELTKPKAILEWLLDNDYDLYSDDFVDDAEAPSPPEFAED